MWCVKSQQEYRNKQPFEQTGICNWLELPQNFGSVKICAIDGIGYWVVPYFWIFCVRRCDWEIVIDYLRRKKGMKWVEILTLTTFQWYKASNKNFVPDTVFCDISSDWKCKHRLSIDKKNIFRFLMWSVVIIFSFFSLFCELATIVNGHLYELIEINNARSV